MLQDTWRYDIAKKLFKRAVSLGPLTRTPFVGKLYHNFFSSEDEGNIIPIDHSISAPDNVILPSVFVRQAVEQASRRFIMHECLCRCAEKCTTYPEELGCIFLGEAARSISPKLGKAVFVNEALDHLTKCESAGLVHVMGHFKFDAIFLNAGPFEKLLSICNCCECCCIFRMYPDLYKPAGDTLKKLEGVELRVGEECVGCGDCLGACFVNAISLNRQQACISEKCRGCGRCVSVCPNNAISLTLEDTVLPTHLLDRIS